MPVINALSSDESFGFEALRAAGHSNYGGSDIAECLAICSRIRPGNLDEWMREWSRAGDRAARNGSRSASVKNTVSAYEAFLRASTYYRTAEFFCREDPFHDEVGKRLVDQSVDAFREAMKYCGLCVLEDVKIPYEETTLPALMYKPPVNAPLPFGREDRSERRPTIIVNSGYDSTKEEAWTSLAAAGVARGFNVLAFEGPGQGAALREQRLFFRPDWEKVLVPVVNYAVKQRRDVDGDALFICGESMGAYLVARGATVEHRARALIFNDGLYDFSSCLNGKLPFFLRYLIDNGYDSMADRLFAWGKAESTGNRWALDNGKWTFGVTSEAELVRRYREYTLEGRADQIVTPCLILNPEIDHFFTNQASVLREHLHNCETEFVTFTQEDGSETHCHQGASARLNEVIFDYIAEKLAEGDKPAEGAKRP